MKNLQIVKQLVTPEIAAQYLEKNTNNRNISDSYLTRYVKNMKDGKWKEDTGELIKISKTGVILDGQHRLMAVVKSGCSIYFHIAYNIDDVVFDVIDTGKPRNPGDCFLLAGVENYNAVSAIIAYYNLLNENKKVKAQKSNRATNSDLLSQYYENPEMWQNSFRVSNRLYRSFSKILSCAYIGGFYAYLRKIDEEKSLSFLTQLCTGKNIEINVINSLRDKLIQDKISTIKMPPAYKSALIIKTWNFYFSGTDSKFIKFNPNVESYPVAKGIKIIDKYQQKS